jgi:hypothetical protein
MALTKIALVEMIYSDGHTKERMLRPSSKSGSGKTGQVHK